MRPRVVDERGLAVDLDNDGKAGTFTLTSRQRSFSGSLQIEVGRQTSIMVSTGDGTVRLSNLEPMNP